MITTDENDGDPMSSIGFAEIKFPQFGVSVDSLSGDIFGTSFWKSEEADIYLDRDTRIPAGHEWSLVGPTNVVMDTDDLGATGPEDDDRIEIDVYGKLRTSGASGDSVVFKSNRPTPVTKDWFGISFRFTDPDTTTVADLQGASIGFCVAPLYFEATDSVLVEDSNIHDFSETGIDLFFADADVIGNTIDGSENASGTLDGALVGIHADRSALILKDNEIGWHREYGAKIEFSKAYCVGLDPSDVDSLFVEGNILTGNGEQSEDYDLGKALAAIWPCEERPLRLFDNTISAWPEVGIALQAPEAVRLECNLIQESRRGLEFAKAGKLSTETVALRRNKFLRNTDENLWADDFVNITLFQNAGAGGFAKENTFQPDSIPGVSDPKPNISNQSWLSGTLNARKSFWMDGGGAILPESDSTYVRGLIVGNDTTAVKITNFRTQVVGCSDLEALVVLQEESLEAGGRSGGEALGLAAEVYPADWDLRVRREFGSTVIQMAVPDGALGSVALNVYDIRGRRVATLLEQEARAGWVEVRWPHADGNGRSVASGVYFIRLEAGDTAIARKAIVLK
ncbi:MAG: hypothetical protein DHS20C21_06500 [Gemmatimonadota bacterium]|nr:MAG: hypothetical protein DHS20C21_06500 [Gemmatimonadota bacterium]